MSGRTSQILLVLLGASVTLNLVLLLQRGGPAVPPVPEAPRAAASAPPSAAPPADPATLATGAIAGPAAGAPVDPAAGAAPASAAPASAAPTDQVEAQALPEGDWKAVRTTIDHSIARSMAQAAGEHGDALSAELARLFVWDVNLNKDLQRGDTLEFAWRVQPDGDYQIAAARLKSGKHGKTFTAYRHQQVGDEHPSYWNPEGVEIPITLHDGPLKAYEQITSLLKDRPTHKGMDFKTPVGTPVHAPRKGVVTRTNWNWSANGNAVELKLDDGVIAKFLHLSENKVRAGDAVEAGQVVALTGNTGHTTAPHLHYQLERPGGAIIDPVEYHQTGHRQLAGDALAAFRTDAARLDTLLATAR